ncbi:hypothetical protein TNCV_4769061 [Trichonephila clavipes]|nr:hypothetical protein TNCV_4769061 [Trichonephila clavipes]
MFDPSSFANPTPLAHADTSRDVLPKGSTSQTVQDFILRLYKDIFNCTSQYCCSRRSRSNNCWEYGIDEFRTAIRNAVLNLNRPLSLAAEKAESCSHVTSPESRIGVVCKTKSVRTNSWTTFAAAFTLSSQTMAAATLDAAS